MVFIASNDAGDTVLVSATDGSVLGVIGGRMNLAFAGWSLDDSLFARLAAENQVEVYRL